MPWTRGAYEVYECIDFMSQPVATPVIAVLYNTYYVYAFTVSEQKTIDVELANPGGSYRRPNGIYYIGMGDVPDPAVEYDIESETYTETGHPPADRIWRQQNVSYGDYDYEFTAMPGTLYWVWMLPTTLGSSYAVKFNIEASDKYAEPVFDARKVGPDGISVKVMDKYSMANGLCQIFIDGVYQDTLEIKSSSNWQAWGISGLDAGTYVITVQYKKSDGTWNNMKYYYSASSATEYATTVTLQGAGSIGNAYFTATGDSSDNTISVDIYSASSISPSVDYFVYNISEESDAFPTNVESSAINHDFTKLLDGTWRVTVYAVLTTGRVLRIPTKARGSTYAITITFGGSGGGGGEQVNTWNIVSENLGIIDSPYVSFNYYDKYTLYRYRASFEYSGDVTFYSGTGTTVELADPKGWITEYTTTYNSDAGQPPPSALVPGKYAEDDDSGGLSQFQMTLHVEAGTEYCFWFRLKDGANTGYTYVGIEPPSGSTTAWKYNSSYLDIRDISGTQTKDVRLQSYEGALFKVTFAAAGIARLSASIPSQTAHVYVTTGQYSWAIDGVPLTESGNKASEISGTSFTVLPDTEYYVWIKGSSTSTRGTATVTILFTQSWKYNYNTNLNIRNVSSTQTRRTSVTRRTGSYFLVTFGTSGTATFSVSGGDAYIAYATDGYHQWDPEDGSPYKDDRKNKAVGGTSVSIDVTTADTYYVWVRGSTETTSGTGIVVTINVQTYDTKGIWICVNKGTQQNPIYEMVKTTVWVFVSGAFAKLKPWLYRNSGWIGGM